MRPFPIEFQLATACCRWPPGEPRRRAVAEAAAQPIDWRRFLTIVARHRVWGLVADGLREAGVAPPQPIAVEIGERERAVAMDGLRHAAETGRLQRLFDQAGIPMLVIKGATIDMLAYGRIGLKQARDVDLLVEPGRVEAAIELLTQEGYSRIEPDPALDAEGLRRWLELSKESCWEHAERRVMVELHGRLADNAAMIATISAESPRRMVELTPGHAVATLGDEELFAYLCLHGATHGWSRLKWLADLNAFLAARVDSIEPLYREARALGAGRGAGQALLLCRKLFGLELPSALARELEGERQTRWLERVALALLVGLYVEKDPNDSVLGTVPIHLSHFLLERGPRYKWEELRRKFIAPHPDMRIRLPGPLALFQPVIGIPFWLWRRFRMRG